MVVNLTFHDFDIEYHPRCEFDHIRLWDFYGNLGSFLCGSKAPYPIKSRGNWMLVLLNTDGEIARQGFYATFEAIDKDEIVSMTTVAQANTAATFITECKGDSDSIYLNGSSGDFSSP
ncbi:unnamed protein product, partial [Owenia fusiformis]